MFINILSFCNLNIRVSKSFKDRNVRREKKMIFGESLFFDDYNMCPLPANETTAPQQNSFTFAPKSIENGREKIGNPAVRIGRVRVD